MIYKVQPRQLDGNDGWTLYYYYYRALLHKWDSTCMDFRSPTRSNERGIDFPNPGGKAPSESSVY
jgi:hypothetical protein